MFIESCTATEPQEGIALRPCVKILTNICSHEKTWKHSPTILSYDNYVIPRNHQRKSEHASRNNHRIFPFPSRIFVLQRPLFPFCVQYPIRDSFRPLLDPSDKPSFSHSRRVYFAHQYHIICINNSFDSISIIDRTCDFDGSFNNKDCLFLYEITKRIRSPGPQLGHLHIWTL